MEDSHVAMSLKRPVWTGPMTYVQESFALFLLQCSEVLPLKRLMWVDSFAAVRGIIRPFCAALLGVFFPLKRLAWMNSIFALGEPSALSLTRYSVVLPLTRLVSAGSTSAR